MFELKETTIRKVHEAYKNNALTCEQFVRAYLKRIEEFDHLVNSVIAINPEAVKQAQRLDAAFAKGGITGPLHGVPILLKDNCETANMPTTAGSKSLEGFCTGQDASIVKKLKDAGAVILAKVNLHEFAVWGETVSSILGQTLNPYDLTRTPGGSSGGTGAAVAANFGLAGIGTDTVNSIRSPASACCLCGIRPTVGMVNCEGIVPYSHAQDTAGPLARTVEDAVRVLDVIADKKGTYLEHLKLNGLQGKRLGILHSFLGKEEINKPVNAVMNKALDIAKQAGAVLLDVNEEIDSAKLITDVSVHLHELKNELEKYFAAVNAPVRSIDDILASGKYSPSIEANLQNANKLADDKEGYNQRLLLREELRKKITSIMDENNIDALIFPHQQQLVCKAGESQLQRNGALGSVTGFPAMAIPAGFSGNIPVGLEILGRPFDEKVLIEIAYGFEQAANVRREPNDLP